MPDWPKAVLHPAPAAIQILSQDTVFGQVLLSAGTNTAAGVWTTANTAVYVGFTLDEPFLLTKIGIHVSVQSGNLDVGVYSYGGTRLVSMGSTAVGAAGLQVLDVTDTWLMPGTYFASMNCDNTTASFFAVNINTAMGRACALLQQAVGAVALPSTATFATYSQRRVPYMLLTGNSVL